MTRHVRLLKNAHYFVVLQVVVVVVVVVVVEVVEVVEVVGAATHTFFAYFGFAPSLITVGLLSIYELLHFPLVSI